MARLLLVGAFGQRNVGDEALCESFCDALHDHAVTLVSADPADTTRRHRRPAVANDPRAVMSAARSCDVVVVGGGTIFKALHPSAGRRPSALLANTLGLLAWAHAHGIPVVLAGVGAGTVHGTVARRLAREISDRCDLLVLRDEESAAVLTSSGVRPPFWIGADPAWCLFDSFEQIAARSERQPMMVVALSHLALTDRASELTARLGAALAARAAEGWRIVLQPWQDGPGDQALADALEALVPSAERRAVPPDLVTAAQWFADADVVVALRFHAIVAAAVAGCRLLVVAHEPKLAALARRLDQISVPPDASTAVIASAIDWATHHRAPSGDAVAGQIDLAHRMLRHVRLAIDGGRLENPEELPALALSNGDGRW